MGESPCEGAKKVDWVAPVSQACKATRLGIAKLRVKTCAGEDTTRILCELKRPGVCV